MAGEQKNAIDYERVHGCPQPRDAHGRFDRDGLGDGVASEAPDWDFVRREEGLDLVAKVPKKDGKPIGRSGVTIGHGFDIGQWSEADFGTLDIEPAEREKLKNRFRPFFGLKGTEAEAALAANGTPTVTRAQAKALFEAVRGRIHDQVRDRYNRDLQDARHEHLPRFEDLPSEAQTVILSVAYQYGADLRRRTPRFWDRVVRQDWQAAVEELRDFGDAVHEKRRKREAARLDDMLRRRRGN